MASARLHCLSKWSACGDSFRKHDRACLIACVQFQVLFYFIDQLIIIVIIFYCLGATSSLHHVLCIAGGTCCPSLHRRVYALPLFGEVNLARERHVSAWPSSTDSSHCKHGLQATAVMIFSVFPAAGISSTWFYYRHESWAWVLQDMLSMSLCIQILSLVFRSCACISLRSVMGLCWQFVGTRWQHAGYHGPPLHDVCV